jgi:ribosomal protein S18 acetylase RimI-like enzyme
VSSRATPHPNPPPQGGREASIESPSPLAGEGRGGGSPDLAIETEVDAATVDAFGDLIYAFNMQATGIRDGKTLAILLRDEAGALQGGIYGWTWGGTCYIQYLLVPAALRRRKLGTRLMQIVEDEARRRGCAQIVLETFDFQAPEFYARLGFRVAGEVANYPRGHSNMFMVKALQA